MENTDGNNGAWGEEGEEPSRCRPLASNPSPITCVPMTPAALAKARRYAELVYEEHGTECMFWLLKPKGARHRTVTDVLFPDGQGSTGTRTTLADEHMKQAATEAEQRGMEILGWSHSHADSLPFHSLIDKDNVFTVGRALSVMNIIKTVRKVVLKRGSRRVACHADSRLRVTAPKGTSLPESVTVELPVNYGFVYSVTVNALQDVPDARVGIYTYCPLCGASQEEQYQSKVRIVRDARLPRAAFKTRQLLADIDARMKPFANADAAIAAAGR